MLSSVFGFDPNCVGSLLSLAVFLPLQVWCIDQSEVKIDGLSKLKVSEDPVDAIPR
jgi:hypothetical protein